MHRALIAAFGGVLLLPGCTAEDPDAGTATPAGSPPSTGTSTATESPPANGAATGTATGTPATETPGAGGGAVISAPNAGSLEQVAELQTAGVTRLDWSGDGSTLLVESNEGVTVYGADSLEQQAMFPAPEPGRGIIGASANAGVVAVAEGPAVTLHDIASGQEMITLDVGTQSSMAAFYEGGASVAIASLDEIAVTLWDVESGEQLGELTGFETAAPVYSVVMSEDGAHAAWVSRGTLQFHDVASNTLGERLQFEDFIADAGFAADGETLLTVTSTQAEGEIRGLLQVWDVATAQELLSVTPEEASLFSAASYSPDGALIAVAYDAGVTFSDAADGSEVAPFDIGAPGRLVAFAPDGRTLATVDEAQVLRLWQPAAEE